MALVIGNGDYEHLALLANPPDDADAIEELLSDLGFDSVRRTDRDADDLARDLERFVEDAEDADVAVLYYAGHGIEAGGENWLVPVDTDISALDEAATKLVPVSDVIRRLRQTVAVTIVLLDACRDNPFPEGATLKVAANADALPVSTGGLAVADTRGASALAKADTTPSDNLGIVIGFAAAPGQVALDGASGENSPYAAALTRHISAMAGEEFGTVMRMVAEEVYLKTGGRQRPWVNESLRRLLYFGEAPKPVEGAEGDILTERRQLLLSIAALPEFNRKQVERIASNGGVPMDAIFGMLRALGRDAPDDPAELEQLLREQTEELKKFLEKRRVIENPDPDLARLSALSDRAVAEGALATARQLRGEVDKRIEQLSVFIDSEEDLIRARRTEFAAEYAKSGEVATLAFDHLKAAEYYEKAYAEIERWDVELAWLYKTAQAGSLRQAGEFNSDNGALEKAIAAGRQALRHADATESRERWALTQNELGNALLIQGTRETDNVRLRQALDAYRAALGVHTRDRHPDDWAIAQNNVGSTLMTLSARDLSRDNLDAAITAYKSALQVRTRENSPYDWALTLHNLGAAMHRLGNLQADVGTLLETAEIYRQALEVRTRDRYPHDWIMTQSSLASVYRDLGKRLNEPTHLERAISIHRMTLEEIPADDMPLMLARSHSGLASALITLAELGGGASGLEEAIGLLDQAALRYSREQTPLSWVKIQSERGTALRMLGSSTRDKTKLKESIERFKSVLEVVTRDKFPVDWAVETSKLASSVAKLAELDNDVASYEEAIRLYSASMAEASEEWVPYSLVALKTNLASALYEVGKRNRDPVRLKRAVALLEDAIQNTPHESSPSHRTTLHTMGVTLHQLGLIEDRTDRLEAAVTALTKARSMWRPGSPGRARSDYFLAEVLVELGNRKQDNKLVQQAMAAYRASLQIWTRSSDPLSWAKVQMKIGDALHELAQMNAGQRHTRDAIVAYREAVAVLPDGAFDRTISQYKLAFLLSIAAKDSAFEQQRSSNLEDAIQAARAAQTVLTRDRFPDRWAILQNLIGYDLVLLGELADDEDLFSRSVPILREALAVQRELGSASQHSTADSLCRALLNLGRHRKDRAALVEARGLCEWAEAGLRASGKTETARESADNLTRVEAALEALE
ncbi:caspase family protein [Mesorhizobium sp. Z1-4]|uniref:caspase family protein n=1 Tax=Mesorhizobium sp. Z1-4 TaxID=2448478 RepID=UPI0013DF955C|nr:caspase family protein [Mesorhizobium sp. Z1-4]